MDIQKIIDFLTSISAPISALAAIVTAIATYFLWRVTNVLAIETKRMSDASSQPHIVTTFDSNIWSMRHFDINIENTGNATAYNISVDIKKESINSDNSELVDFPSKIKRIDVLKPGTKISSYQCEYDELRNSILHLSIMWNKIPNSNNFEKNSYSINIDNIANQAKVGDDPLVLIGNEIKKIREDIGRLTSSNRRLEINTYSAEDRNQEFVAHKKAIDEAKKKYEQRKNNIKTTL
ncbi:hypothetical protein [Yersinia proxima]|uniref:hypothetical protein n=1 Tax=Yersinia proxima TaxID=2890316 RepID=UPI003D691F5C